MITIISPPRVESAVVSLEEVLRRNKALQRQASRRRNVAAPVSGVSGTFSIAETSAGYQLHNVPHRDGLYDMLWSKDLLPGDGSKTPGRHLQCYWLSHPKYRTVDEACFDLPSGPEYASTLLALYHHSNTTDATQQRLLADFQDVLVQDFEKWVMTSTRIAYRPDGVDVVEHCRERTSGGYAQEGAVAGVSGLVNVAMSSEMGALLGVIDVQEFMDVVKWLTEKDAHLWCIEKPASSDKRALVLGVVGGGRFNISANFLDIRPARGVAVREIFSPIMSKS